MEKSINLVFVSVFMVALTLTILLIASTAMVKLVHGQIIPKNNTQNTSPNNKTSIMIIINHGAANYTISDFIPTMLPDKCPMTAHIINNNNISTTTDSLPAKPVIICYI